MVDHAEALVAHHGDERVAMRAFRKHASLVPHRLPGRRRVRAAASPRSPRWPSSTTSSPPSIRRSTVVEGGERIRRGHTNGPIKVALPDGFLDDLDALEDDVAVPEDDDVMALSGG